MLQKTDPDIIKGYLEDSSNLSGGFAKGVFLPESEGEICEAVRYCQQQKEALTISAGQTGTTGGCIPFGGWIVSTQKLNKIIALNPKEKTAVVQPGVTLEEIEAAASKEGLFYPPDPTEKKATIGGNVSTNASGSRGYRFGSTRDYVRRLRIIQANGTGLNLKRGIFFADQHENFELPHIKFKIPQYTMPKVKNAAGYFSRPGMDLVDLFIGQEGTLGIISEIEIALLPALRETFDLVAFFSTEEDAIDFIFEAKQPKDPSINLFEYFDENTLQMLKSAYPKIPDGAKAAIYVEQEITAENEQVYLGKWEKLLKQHRASLDNCWLGMNPSQKTELKEFRHAIPEQVNELFKKHKMIKLATDIAVPEDKFREMFNYYNTEIKQRAADLFFIKFGHIGENHLHVNVLPKSEPELELAKEIIMAFVVKAVSLGGTVSAEHGIGKIKHPYLKTMYGESGINEMLRIKNVFDPNHILGINNIFPQKA